MTSATSCVGDQRLELLDLAGAEQRRRARRRHRHEQRVDDIEVDRLGEARPPPARRSCGECSGARARRGARRRSAALAARRAASSTGTSTSARAPLPRGARSVAAPCVSVLVMSDAFVDMAAVLLASAGSASMRWTGCAGHDGRDRMLVHELRVTVAAQQHTEIVEPGHDALQLHAVDRERSSAASCSCARGSGTCPEGFGLVLRPLLLSACF